MIPNVTKGGDISALMRYLAGKGKANEYTNPHVISEDGFLVAWHGADELDGAGAGEIAAYIDAPRVQYGVEMRAQITEQDPFDGDEGGARVQEAGLVALLAVHPCGGGPALGGAMGPGGAGVHG